MQELEKAHMSLILEGKRKQLDTLQHQILWKWQRN